MLMVDDTPRTERFKGPNESLLFLEAQRMRFIERLYDVASRRKMPQRLGHVAPVPVDDRHGPNLAAPAARRQHVRH